jgi:hypothetical protein
MNEGGTPIYVMYLPLVIDEIKVEWLMCGRILNYPMCLKKCLIVRVSLWFHTAPNIVIEELQV